MDGEARFASVGTLRYGRYDDGRYRLALDVDPEIVRYARALVPRARNLRMQRYPPHISIVRFEVPPRLDLWGAHEGLLVPFEYSQCVYDSENYHWLRAWSPDLTRIRLELGLPASTQFTRPPDSVECFHITIGNTKDPSGA